MKKTYKSVIAAAIHETAVGLYNAGVLPRKTMRELNESCLKPVRKFTPNEILDIRENTCLDQATFARFLNVTPGLVSQWERGLKSPSGAALKLLALVQKKGLDGIA